MLVLLYQKVQPLSGHYPLTASIDVRAVPVTGAAVLIDARDRRRLARA